MKLPAWLLDPIIRRKVAFERIPIDRFRVRVARTTRDYEGAFRLVHAAYVFMGIETLSMDGMRVVPQHLLPESTVFVAYEGEALIATMTVIEDSPAGLPLAKEYGEPIARLRGQGAKLVEFASLAVVQRYWRSGVTQLLSMAAYNFAYNHRGATHTVVGINPRAAPFYRAMFQFTELGSSHEHTALRAPVVGLVQDMNRAQGFVRSKFPKRMATGKTPFEHFMHEPPPCIQMPPQGMSQQQLARWKLPREVFQELFLHKTDRVHGLDPLTLEYLQHQRTRDTLGVGDEEVARAVEIARRMVASGHGSSR